MKKFKLIKRYPGLSPKVKIGDIAVTKKGWGCYGIYSRFGEWSDENYFLNEPGFWEECKEYEILSFITEDMIFTKNSEGRYGNENSVYWTLEDELKAVKNGYRKIHSVKRLSDEEIFFIGDKVTYKTGSNWIINNFSIDSDGDYMMASAGTLKDPWCSISNENFSKSKTKLFTTEDGIDIFEGDKFYYIMDNWRILEFECKTKESKSSNGLDFSTKEKAEEYILENKPCLSLMDCLKWATSDEKARLHLNLDKLKLLVKSKL